MKQFALDKLRHKMRLKGVRDGDMMLQDEEIGSLGIADSLRDVKPHTKMTYQELPAYTVKKEQQVFGFYSQLAKSAKAPIIREMFAHQAREEAEHKLKLEIECDLT